MNDNGDFDAADVKQVRKRLKEIEGICRIARKWLASGKAGTGSVVRECLADMSVAVHSASCDAGRFHDAIYGSRP